MKLDYPQDHVVPDSYLGVFEPLLDADNEVLFAKSVSPVNRGLIMARVLNPNPHSVDLRVNRFLGKFYSLDHENSEFELIEDNQIHSDFQSDSEVISAGITTNHDTSNNKTPPSVEFDQDNLTPEEIKQVEVLLDEYADTFSKKPGRTHLAHHKIRTENVTPIKLRAYRSSPPKKAVIEK